MAIPDKIELCRADWSRDQGLLMGVREAVFVVEQGVPAEIERDVYDAVSLHVLGYYRGEPVATGRLLPDGHIGRVAVLKPYRGLGFGKAIMAALIEQAQAAGHTHLELSSQVHALGFYQSLGFVADGDEYLEAGILHRRMIWAGLLPDQTEADG